MVLLGVEPQGRRSRHRTGIVEHPFPELKEVRIVVESQLKRRKLLGRRDRKRHLELAFRVRRDIAECHRDNRWNERVRVMYENRRRGIRYRVRDETVVVYSRYACQSNRGRCYVVLILRVESQVECIRDLVFEDYRILAAIFKRSAAANHHSLEVRKRLVAGNGHWNRKFGQRIDRDIAH